MLAPHLLARRFRRLDMAGILASILTSVRREFDLKNSERAPQQEPAGGAPRRAACRRTSNLKKLRARRARRATSRARTSLKHL